LTNKKICIAYVPVLFTFGVEALAGTKDRKSNVPQLISKSGGYTNMRKAAIAGLFAFVTILIASGSSASAETFDILKISKSQQGSFTASVALQPIVLASSKSEKIQPDTQLPEQKIHEVQGSETLTLIAEQYQTTWDRLFNKNTQIAHPDVIKVGDKITIPTLDEVLAAREIPAPPAPSSADSNQSPSVSSSSPIVTARGASSGNTYSPGYCTWYAKNMRPDLPNNLGNADTWVVRAAAQGIPTGGTPAPGAIGQQGMHVVYVERVNPDGTVLISEMNFTGLYAVSTRTVAASTFRYIY
jgi:surface antigen